MNKTVCSFLLAAALINASSLSAQTTTAAPAAPAAPAATVKAPPTPRARTSPHETVGAVIDGNRVTIIYGRPYSKDPKTGAIRKIWGGLVPYDQVWRMGSDEATLLVTQRPISFGTATIPAGAYTLWLQPAADGSAKLFVNKEIGQWGIDKNGALHNAQLDIAQVDLKAETLDTSVDQFTIAVVKNASGGGGAIKLLWETQVFSASFTVSK